MIQGGSIKRFGQKLCLTINNITDFELNSARKHLSVLLISNVVDMADKEPFNLNGLYHNY